MACYCMLIWGGDRGGLLLYVNMGKDRGGLLLYVNMGEDRGGLLLRVNMGGDRGGLLLYVNMEKIGVACYCMLTWGEIGWPVTVC